MLLYDGWGPNPRGARMLLIEKGIDIPRRELDILKGETGENRTPPYTDFNPGGQLPGLQLDDGRFIGETVAIYDYLEEKFPKPPVIGTTAEERAETHQWQRRVELNITENLYNGFRFAEGLKLFTHRVPCVPEAGKGLKWIAAERLKWLEGLMADGRQWIAGNRFTIADIILYVALDFGGAVGQGLDPSLKNLNAWFNRVSARPSAKKSLHPRSAELKMPG